MKTECPKYFKYTALLSLLLIGVVSIAGCTNTEKAKADHVSKGEAYLKETKFQEAALEFRNAIQLDENYAAAHWGLARAYEGLQRPQEFFDELRKTVQLDANNLDARVKLGTLYIAVSKNKPETIAEAEKLANEVLQKDPNHIEGHILLGTVYFARNERDKGLAELNRAVELDPKRVESYLSLARFYVVTQDRTKAEETFRRALTVNFNSGVAHTEFGKFLIQTNRPAEGQAEFEKAVEVEPANRPSRLVLASYYLLTKQLDKAEAAYKALAGLDSRPENQAVLGDYYSAVDRYDDAIRIYQDIVTKSPDYLAGRYRLGEILLARGDIAGTNDQIDKILKKDPTDRQALILRARVRLQSGLPSETKAAIEDLKEVLRQEPNSQMGLYFMAQANFNLGSIDQARAFAADLEKNYPDYLPAKLMQTIISLALGDPKAAFVSSSDLLERLNKTGPDNQTSPQMLAELRSKALITRGTAQAQLQNRAAARQDFNAAIEASPNNTDAYVNLAALAAVENKPDEAITNYEKALSISATETAALNGLITLYAQRKETPKAHARIDQALGSYPNNAALHYLKATIYGYEANAQAAESELRKTIELDPNNLAAYSALGALFVNTNQGDRAIAEYKRVIELRPENPTAYTLVGMIYDGRKEYDTAIDFYRRALEKDPNAVIAANNLAWIYAAYDKGSLDEAVRLAQGVVQKNSTVAGFTDTLGWVYYKKGLNAVAVEQLQKAVALDDAAAKKGNGNPSPVYRYHLGMALKAKGDKEGARRELGMALRLADKTPFHDQEEARKALATL
ncbi:MAG TPA: tetratricopeptide repeat protein [Pyrinomonadaceae bacterium]|nr:tetratricopeptide repeat protein [Pyrinomonadaceae bacterium]